MLVDRMSYDKLHGVSFSKRRGSVDGALCVDDEMVCVDERVCVVEMGQPVAPQ